ncbi:hypothetical protein QV08_10630 [Gallibacterium salpingitidis]|uniref:tetratricopeptide repeat protein n=1 Tax=Gallibacterium salpingitidis TaxID=505341 RepID=UPI000805791F|nr:SEL1-like repeat protein [Gallibacterium salpingitidis]OBX06252.1 hypothetical protein QV08_10630 [Gallibacterium salpingitidis]
MLQLFKNIFTTQNDSIKEIYNKGVIALAAGNLDQAIQYFEKVSDQHPSAAYNLGLIYLNGDGKILPKYTLARKYLSLANKLDHPKALPSSQIIGLTVEKKLSMKQQMDFFKLAVAQYADGHQLGNLAYLIAYDIKRNILETSSNEIYSLDRFLSYELYCIQKYGSEEVKSLYKKSSLINLPINYLNDWENGETSIISDYLSEKVWPNIIILSDGKLEFTGMGILRIAVVNTVYEYYL